MDQRFSLTFVIVRKVEKLGIKSLFGPTLLVRRAHVIKLTLNQLPACDFVEDAAVRLIFLSIEAGQQVFDHTYFLILRHLVVLRRILRYLLLFVEVVCCDDIPVRIGQDVPLAGQKSHLVKEPRDTIHLDQVLNVALHGKPLRRDLEFLVAVELPFAPGSATTVLEAADCPEVGNRFEEAVARCEFLPSFNLGAKSFFWRLVSPQLVRLIGSPLCSSILVHLAVQALDEGLLSDKALIARYQERSTGRQRVEQATNIG